MHEPIIFEATEAKAEYLESINMLLPQLSQSAQPMTIEALNTIITSPDTYLLLLQQDGKIVGMCTLAVYYAPTGSKAWIEDVVIDNNMRGKKLGRLLIEHAIASARRYSPCTLMLTSRPARVAANALYQSAGFEQKTTNVYKLKV